MPRAVLQLDRGQLSERYADADAHRPADHYRAAPGHPGAGADDQCAASDHQHFAGDDGATFHRSALGHADGRADRDRDV